MNAILTLINSTLAYGDVGVTSNPTKRYVDWGVSRNYPVKNPKSTPYTIDPGATVTLFSGLRTTTIDNTTEFSVALSPLSSNRYRFAWTGVGTTPGLRADRSLALNTRTITTTANANLTLTLTSSGVGDFASVVAGDTLLIPDVSTGDVAGPFNALNGGYWVVLSKDLTSTTLQIARPSGAAFVGISEVVVVTANSQVVAFSVTGVQIGDKVTLSAGFPSALLTTYEVVAVTSTYFEVISTAPLPIGVVAVPTIAGINFYTAAKRYIRCEADQECVLRLNGDTGNFNRLSPWIAADQDNTAFFEKVGPCWSVTVVNLSSAPLEFLMITAE